MCTQEDCVDGDQSFGSRQSWIDHLRSHQVHGSSEPAVDTCPFCLMEFEPGLTHSYYKHVGYHLEEIRLLSLPLYFRDSCDEVFQDSSSEDEPEPEPAFPNRKAGLSIVEEETTPDASSTRSLKLYLRSCGTTSKENRTAHWISHYETGDSLNPNQVSYFNSSSNPRD